MSKEQATVDVEEAVVRFVEEHPGTTFGVLTQFLDGIGFPTSGSQYVGPGGYPNLITWAGMSEAYRDLVIGFINSDRLVASPTSVLTYFIDGGNILDMPIAKRPPKAGYREPHWAPAVPERLGRCPMSKMRGHDRTFPSKFDRVSTLATYQTLPEAVVSTGGADIDGIRAAEEVRLRDAAAERAERRRRRAESRAARAEQRR